MTAEEITGRLVVLEVLSMTTLGLYLANSRNDPDYSKARALLDHIKQTIAGQVQMLPPSAQAAAAKYADHLVETLLANLRQLHGEGGATH
jgi:hypothetical protein